jgi:hypothetical protein
MLAKPRQGGLPQLTWAEDPAPGRRRWSWVVCEPWQHQVNGFTLHVPAGFRTDLASIPRVLWWLPGFAPMELGVEAPIVHDLLYQNSGVCRHRDEPPHWFSRRDVDRIFKVLMREAGVGGFRRSVAWAAVRGFGWFAWKSAR